MDCKAPFWKVSVFSHSKNNSSDRLFGDTPWNKLGIHQESIRILTPGYHCSSMRPAFFSAAKGQEVRAFQQQMGISYNGDTGIPQKGWFMMDNPIEMIEHGWFGGIPMSPTPKSTYMIQWMHDLCSKYQRCTWMSCLSIHYIYWLSRFMCGPSHLRHIVAQEFDFWTTKRPKGSGWFWFSLGSTLRMSFKIKKTLQQFGFNHNFFWVLGYIQ